MKNHPTVKPDGFSGIGGGVLPGRRLASVLNHFKTARADYTDCKLGLYKFVATVLAVSIVRWKSVPWKKCHCLYGEPLASAFALKDEFFTIAIFASMLHKEIIFMENNAELLKFLPSKIFLLIHTSKSCYQANAVIWIGQRVDTIFGELFRHAMSPVN
jgi:hypothetical protein